MAEMNWGQIKSGGNGDATPYVKLQPGENRMRIVGLPYEVDIHWEETVDGSKKRIVCLGSGCPICKAGHIPQKRFQILVIDRTDNKLKILEGGNSIFRQVKDYAMDPDYGDPTKYDIKIKKEGSGRETKYSVMASPKKSDLTAEETELLGGAKTLAEINKVKTVEELAEMQLQVLASSAGFDDDWDETPMNVSTDSASDDWDDL